jgi:hypothetical protein
MLTLGNILTNTMTLSKTGTETLTKEEWDELVALKNAINEYPGTVCPQQMEKFTELLVRTLEGKSDPLPPKNWSSPIFGR